MSVDLCGCHQVQVAPTENYERFKSLALGVVIGLASLAAVAAVTSVIMKRYPQLKVSSHLPFAKYPVLQQIWKAVRRIMAAVGAPLIEEVLFRGLLNDKIQEWSGKNNLLKRVVRIVAIALLFGAAHLSFLQSKTSNLLAFGTTASLGLVFGVLKEVRGDLLSPMAAHAAYNIGAMF